MNASNRLCTLTLLGLIAFVGCSKKEPPQVQPVKKVSQDSVELSKDALANVVVMPVKISDFPEQLHVMGKITVAEDRVSTVAARISGRIDTIFVSTGEEVKAGQPLATVFSADLIVGREEYLQSVRQHIKTKNETDLYLVNLSRRKLESLGMSKWDIDNMTRSSAGVFYLRSPRAGAILEKKIAPGALVNAGDVLFTVGDLRRVWFAGDLYPEDLPRVKKGQEVMVQVEGSSETVKGVIDFISPVLDPMTRTVKVRAHMDNPQNLLRADMYVRGDITLNKASALQVPKEAVIIMNDETYCFRRSKDNIFRRVKVEIGDERAGHVVVRQGLQDGDSVVSSGTLLLNAALVN